MKKANVKIGLSKREDMPILYFYLVNYEKNIKLKSGSFNIDSESFKAFCKLNNVKLKDSLAKRELDKKDKTDNYFFFKTTQNLVSKKDKAHHIFRHIRNSIAHALIFKNGGYYMFTDKNSSNNISMTGKIRIDLFESFIAELLKTSSLN